MKGEGKWVLLTFPENYVDAHNLKGKDVYRERGWYNITVASEYKFDPNVTNELVPENRIITAFWFGTGFSCKMKTVPPELITEINENKVTNPNAV